MIISYLRLVSCIWVMKHTTHTSSTRSLNLSPASFPARSRQILNHASSFGTLAKIAAYFGAKKGLDPDDLAQDVALRLFKCNSMVESESSWRGLCATIASNLCRDFWRRQYCRNAVFCSMDEQIAGGIHPVETEAALVRLSEDLHQKELDQEVARRGAALARLAGDSTRLSRGAQRVLKVFMAHGDHSEAFKKNGTLNGNALAHLGGINQSSISRNMASIQEAATEIYKEIEIDI